MQSKTAHYEGKNPEYQNREDLPYKKIIARTPTGIIICHPQTSTIVECNPAACSILGFQPEELAGRRLIDLIKPGIQEVFKSYAAQILGGSLATAQFPVQKSDGTTAVVEMQGNAVELFNETYMLNTLHDVSRWIQAEESFERQAQAHLREQSTLLQISQTLASTLELKPGIVLDQLRVVIEYMHAVRFTLTNMTLIAVSARGSAALEKAVPFEIRLSDPQILTTLFNEHRPSRIDDVWKDETDAQFLRSLLNETVTGLLDGMRSWMWVPIAVKGRLLGGLGVTHSQAGFFTPHQADLALTVANQAAVAMANAELYVHAQTLAALQERQRLARDLHDAVNQSLFSAGLIAEVLPRLWDRDPDDARRSLEDLRRLTHGAQADMRLLLAELRPNTLTDSDLGDLLHLLANALTGRTNIKMNIVINGSASLPGDVQLAFYRMCQEAINNIVKHAEATKVDVTLEYDRDFVDLSIHDDGHGFSPETVPPGHYGLSMMRERGDAVGISVSIESQIGKGSTILLRWQMPR